MRHKIFIYFGKNACLNYRIVYEGYRNNYPIYKLNDQTLKNYNEEKNGNSVILYKVENKWYGSTQSYDEPSMDKWIKEYYDLPEKVKFEWRDIYEEFR